MDKSDSLFSHHGRYGRQQFWMTYLALAFIAAICAKFAEDLDWPILNLALLPILWAIMTTIIKRWHDRGRSTSSYFAVVGIMVVLSILRLEFIVGLLTIWLLIDLGCIGAGKDAYLFDLNPDFSNQTHSENEKQKVDFGHLDIGNMIACWQKLPKLMVMLVVVK